MKEQLFDTSSEFYAWYMAHVDNPQRHIKTFKALSKLMRISLISSKGGFYLSAEEEKEAVSLLETLKEDLFEGKHPDILMELETILLSLTNKNSKALLVVYATEIEYAYSTHEKPSNLQRNIEQLLNHLSPSLPEITTSAINQLLSQMLKNQLSPEDFELEITKWLKDFSPKHSNPY
jgi:hypothetical protein